MTLASRKHSEQNEQERRNNGDRRWLPKPTRSVCRYNAENSGKGSIGKKIGSRIRVRFAFNRQYNLRKELSDDDEIEMISETDIRQVYSAIRLHLYGVLKFQEGILTYEKMTKRYGQTLLDLGDVVERTEKTFKMAKGQWAADWAIQDVLHRDRKTIKSTTANQASSLPYHNELSDSISNRASGGLLGCDSALNAKNRSEDVLSDSSNGSGSSSSASEPHEAVFRKSSARPVSGRRRNVLSKSNQFLKASKDRSEEITADEIRPTVRNKERNHSIREKENHKPSLVRNHRKQDRKRVRRVVESDDEDIPSVAQDSSHSSRKKKSRKLEHRRHKSKRVR